MSENTYSVARLNYNEGYCLATLDAERRLFEHYDVEVKVHTIEMRDPDIRVRVFDIGAGEPLLVVPGGSGEAAQLIPLLAALKGWRFIVVNRPGGGLSDYLDVRQLNFRSFAVKTLTSVMDAMNVQRVSVVGNSMGGLWSFWLALDRPERVESLVQLGCPALLLDTAAPLFMRLMTLPVLDSVISRFMIPKSLEAGNDGLKMMGSRPQQLSALPTVLAELNYHYRHIPAYRDTWPTLIKTVLTPSGGNPRMQLGEAELRKVTQPVLFIWGDKDPFGSLETAHTAIEVMPDAELCEVRTGHLPHMDEPEECAHLISRFLSKMSSATPA